MLSAFVKAIGQIGDPRIVRVLFGAVALSIAVFIGLWVAVSYLLNHTRLFEMAYLNTAIDVLGGLATLVVSWILFPAVASTAVGFFLEGVAAAVDARYYPWRGEPRRQTVVEVVLGSVRFVAILVVLNLLALGFLLVPPLFPFVFFAINGYLLGREYFELVALRRLAPEQAQSLRRAHLWKVSAAGVVIAVLLTVPFANLVAPVVGTAAMVHIFEELRRDA